MREKSHNIVYVALYPESNTLMVQSDQRPTPHLTHHAMPHANQKTPPLAPRWCDRLRPPRGWSRVLRHLAVSRCFSTVIHGGLCTKNFFMGENPPYKNKAQ